MRGALGERGGDDRPLREALGRRHLERLVRADETEAAVHGFVHLGGGPLARGRGLFRREAGVGERRALLEGFQPGFPAFGAHAERHERAGLGLPVEGHHAVRIGLAGGRGHDLDHFAPEAAAFFQQGQERGLRRRAFEIVERADEHRAVFLAGLADLAAHHGRGLHFQVHVFGAGLDGLEQLVFSEFLGRIAALARLGRIESLLGEHLAGVVQQVAFRGDALREAGDPARRDERHVGLREELFDLLLVQVAEVQPDLRHLHFPAFQDLEDLFQRLALYGCTNHNVNALSASATVRSRMMTEPMRSARTKCTSEPSAFLSLSMAPARVSTG